MPSLTRAFGPVAMIVALAACSQAPEGPLEAAPTVTVTELDVAQDLTAGVPYEARLPYEIEGEGDVSVTRSCFTWSGEGPYCFDVSDRRDRMVATSRLRTGNPNDYLLAGYLEYVANGHRRKSNTAAAEISVR